MRVVGGMRCVWEDPGWREGRGEGKGVRGRGVLLCGLALTTVPRNPPPASPSFTGRSPRGPGESLLRRGLATHPLGLGT